MFKFLDVCKFQQKSVNSRHEIYENSSRFIFIKERERGGYWNILEGRVSP